MLEAAHLGDAEGLIALHQELGRIMRLFAPRYGFSRDDAEDLAGDAYLALLENPRRLELGSRTAHPGAWLRWSCRGFLSHAARRSPPPALDLSEEGNWQPAGCGESPIALPPLAEQDEALIRARAVLGYSWVEVGQALGVSPVAARKRWERLRRRIVARLQAAEIAP